MIKLNTKDKFDNNKNINMNKNGNIGVTSENIFPIIKKFLYSDHEIFCVNWFQMQ